MLVFVLVFMVIRDRRSMDAKLTELHVARERDLQSQAERYDTLLSTQKSAQASLRTEHKRAMERLKGEHARAAESAEASLRVARSRIETELLSRDTIVAVCESLGLSAVVATNVVFVVRPDDKPAFVTQIDHVILTETAAMVIENKDWRGIVFDGVLPSVISPVFGHVVPDSFVNQAGPYSVRINAFQKSQGIDLLVMDRDDGPAPRQRVRTLATQLGAELEDQIGWSCSFHTCVLYSNPNVKLYAQNPSGSSTRDEAFAVDSAAGLATLIKVWASAKSRETRSPLVEVVPVLATLGADLRGTGAFAGRWPARTALPTPDTADIGNAALSRAR